MVMLANNKTMEQIAQDLELFLSENTQHFTNWLQEAVSNPEILRRGVGVAGEREGCGRRLREVCPTQRFCTGEEAQISFSREGRGKQLKEACLVQVHGRGCGRWVCL